MKQLLAQSDFLLQFFSTRVRLSAYNNSGEPSASIRKRGDRQWEARVRKRGHSVPCQTFTTKVKACAWATIVESERERGVFVSQAEAEVSTYLRPENIDFSRQVSPVPHPRSHSFFSTMRGPHRPLRDPKEPRGKVAWCGGAQELPGREGLRQHGHAFGCQGLKTRYLGLCQGQCAILLTADTGIRETEGLLRPAHGLCRGTHVRQCGVVEAARLASGGAQ